MRSLLVLIAFESCNPYVLFNNSGKPSFSCVVLLFTQRILTDDHSSCWLYQLHGRNTWICNGLRIFIHFLQMGHGISFISSSYRLYFCLYCLNGQMILYYFYTFFCNIIVDLITYFYVVSLQNA